VSGSEIALDVLPTLIGIDAVRSYFGHRLHFAGMRQQAELEGDPKLLEDANEQERGERRVWRNFDLALYSSEGEVESVRRMSSQTLVWSAKCSVLAALAAAEQAVGRPISSRDER
jgi:hypothetical protein